jgi:hypothetical protein
MTAVFTGMGTGSNFVIYQITRETSVEDVGE